MESCPCMAKESDQGVEHRGQAGVESDLSPIESVWALMDWQIKMSGKYDLSTMKLSEYKATVLAELEHVCTPQLLKKLCGGMHKRMCGCIKRKGAKISK